MAARYLVADAEEDLATGLPAVLDWRAGLYHRTNLDAWASAGGQIWNLPPRWQWTPNEVADSGGPNGTATLAHLSTACTNAANPPSCTWPPVNPTP